MNRSRTDSAAAPAGVRATETFEGWMPEWGMQVREQLRAAKFPMTPLWLQDGDKVTFWDNLWGLRGWENGGRSTSAYVDTFMSKSGLLWSVYPRTYQYLAARDGVVRVDTGGGEEVAIHATNSIFLVDGPPPVRADRISLHGLSDTLRDEIGEPILLTLAGTLRLGKGMIVGTQRR